MTKYPSHYSVPLTNIVNNYGATYFRDAFATYWAQLCSKLGARPRDVQQAADDYVLPFQKVSAFHKIKFFHTDPEGYIGSSEVQDAIHAQPACRDKHNKKILGRFDTTLLKDGHGTFFMSVHQLS
jgi:hypothetical protein